MIFKIADNIIGGSSGYFRNFSQRSAGDFIRLPLLFSEMVKIKLIHRVFSL